MPKVQVQDAEIYYEIHGEGHPLIFIHGGGGNTMAWFQQVPFFAKNYKVVTVDLRGFKNSPCAPGLAHPRFFYDDMLAILDAEGFDRAAFVCQSLGAWAGLPVAVRSPERVSCLYINGSPTPAYSEENWNVLRKGSDIFMGGSFGRGEGVGWNRRTLETNPELVFLYSQIKALNPAPGFDSATMMDDVIKLYPEDFEGYKVPTIITGGAHDDFLVPGSHEHTATLIPGCKTYTFEDAGHSAYFETAPEFNRIVAEFLDTHLKG
ncbi:TPA: alpha/beta fold hydrolase [Klebsiella oxytoca]